MENKRKKPEKLRISDHAVERFRQRIPGYKFFNDEDVKDYLNSEFRYAMCISRKTSVKGLIKHRYEQTEVYATPKIVFVVSGNRLNTVYPLHTSRYAKSKDAVEEYYARKGGKNISSKMAKAALRASSRRLCLEIMDINRELESDLND
jgi:hypothetical protein